MKHKELLTIVLNKINGAHPQCRINKHLSTLYLAAGIECFANERKLTYSNGCFTATFSPSTTPAPRLEFIQF